MEKWKDGRNEMHTHTSTHIYTTCMRLAFSYTNTHTHTHTRARTAHNLDGQDIPGPLEPLANVLFVKVKDAADMSAGGIVLPDQV